MTPPINYRKLEAYRTAFQLGLDILQISSYMPHEALDTVTKGMLKASQMVSVKIAEGWSRRSRPGALEEHIYDAETALKELQLWLMVSLEYRYISPQAYAALKPTIDSVGCMMQDIHSREVVYN